MKEILVNGMLEANTSMVDDSMGPEKVGRHGYGVIHILYSSKVCLNAGSSGVVRSVQPSIEVPRH